MKPCAKRLAAAMLVAAAVAAFWLARGVVGSISPGEKTLESVRTRPVRPDSDRERIIAENTSRRNMAGDWRELLDRLRGEPRPDAEEIRSRLLEMRLAWTETDPQIRAEVISRLLESGEDAATGLEFKVGNHGQLAGWPTLRVFLLDVLATSDPQMAMATARRVLDSTNSADEFATALRSLTRNGLARAADEELLARFSGMLARPEWRQSRAFAEALDLARFVGTPAAARQLADWPGDPTLKSMAMDEFAADHPDSALRMIQDNVPSLDPAALANLMARMDPADPVQRAAVDSYVRDPARTPEEIAGFLKIYPLRSATTGFRLYGKTPSPYTFGKIAEGDRLAEQQVAAWLADPALSMHQHDLTALRQRLAKWVEEAK